MQTTSMIVESESSRVRMILQPDANGTHFGSCGFNTLGRRLSITKSELYIKTQRKIPFVTILSILYCISLSYMFTFAKCLHFPKMLHLETYGMFHVKQSTVAWVGMVVVLVWKPGKIVNSVQFEPTSFFNCLAWQLN